MGSGVMAKRHREAICHGDGIGDLGLSRIWPIIRLAYPMRLAAGSGNRSCGSNLKQSIRPIRSIRDWTTITTTVLCHPTGKANAKGRTTNEFRVPRLNAKARPASKRSRNIGDRPHAACDRARPSDGKQPKLSLIR